MKTEGKPVDGWGPVLWSKVQKENVAFFLWIRRILSGTTGACGNSIPRQKTRSFVPKDGILWMGPNERGTEKKCGLIVGS